MKKQSNMSDDNGIDNLIDNNKYQMIPFITSITINNIDHLYLDSPKWFKELNTKK